MRWLEFSVDLILSATLLYLEFTQLLTEMSTRFFLGGDSVHGVFFIEVQEYMALNCWTAVNNYVKLKSKEKITVWFKVIDGLGIPTKSLSYGIRFPDQYSNRITAETCYRLSYFSAFYLSSTVRQILLKIIASQEVISIGPSACSTLEPTAVFQIKSPFISLSYDWICSKNLM
jgi:hypothetical protein